MPKQPAVDERTVQRIVDEALREEAREPSISGELPDEGTITALGKIELEEAGGGRVRLGSLWEAEAAALIFLRHYG
jgi:hypothetical protein